MKTELRKIGQGLGDADLHVMTWNAFVISDGFVRDQRALGRISHSDHDASRPFPIRRARDVVRRLSLGEVRDWFHRYRRFRQKPE